AQTAQILAAPRIVDGAGRTRFTPPEPRPRIAMIRRSTLQGMLLDAMERMPGISFRFGSEVIHADPSGSLMIRNAERESTFQADLVVGADGVHSAVRTSGRFGARVSPPGITYVRALAPGGLAREEEAWTAAGLFGSFPVDEGT